MIEMSFLKRMIVAIAAVLCISTGVLLWPQIIKELSFRETLAMMCLAAALVVSIAMVLAISDFWQHGVKGVVTELWSNLMVVVLAPLMAFGLMLNIVGLDSGTLSGAHLVPRVLVASGSLLVFGLLCTKPKGNERV